MRIESSYAGEMHTSTVHLSATIASKKCKVACHSVTFALNRCVKLHVQVYGTLLESSRVPFLINRLCGVGLVTTLTSKNERSTDGLRGKCYT